MESHAARRTSASTEERMREDRVSVKEDRVSVRARVMEDRMREYRVSVKEDRVMEDRMREYRVCVRARVKEVFPCVVRLGYYSRSILKAFEFVL